MITHEKFRNTITDIELKGNELSNGEFEVQALPLTNIMHEYSMQYVLLERDVKRYFEIGNKPEKSVTDEEIKEFTILGNKLMKVGK